MKCNIGIRQIIGGKYLSITCNYDTSSLSRILLRNILDLWDAEIIFEKVITKERNDLRGYDIVGIRFITNIKWRDYLKVRKLPLRTKVIDAIDLNLHSTYFESNYSKMCADCDLRGTNP